MSVLLRRWLFVMILSGGLALLLTPFPYATSHTEERDVVNLRRSRPPRVREAPPTSVSREVVEAYPRLARILETMDERSEFRGSLLQDEFLGLCESLLGGCERGALLRYEGMSLELEFDDSLARLMAEAGGEPEGLIVVRRVTVVAPADLPERLEASDLDEAPALHALLSSVEDRPNLPFDLGVPVGEWWRLAAARGWPDEAEFLFGDWHYRASVESRWVDETVSVPGLKTASRWVGPAALAVSAWLGIGLYRSRRTEGIALASRGVTALYDGLSVVFVGLAWIPVLDHLMERFFETEPILGDEALSYVAAIVGAGTALALAYFTSELAESCLVVSDREIELNGLFGPESVSWKNVEAFSLRDSYLVVGRLGYMIPRRFRRNLRIDTMGTPIYVKEPPHQETRLRILTELRLAAPERLQGDLEKIAGAW